MILFYVDKNYDQIKCILIVNYVKLYKARRAAWGGGGRMGGGGLYHGSTWYCIVLYIYFPETVQTHVI